MWLWQSLSLPAFWKELVQCWDMFWIWMVLVYICVPLWIVSGYVCIMIGTPSVKGSFDIRLAFVPLLSVLEELTPRWINESIICMTLCLPDECNAVICRNRVQRNADQELWCMHLLFEYESTGTCSSCLHFYCYFCRSCWNCRAVRLISFIHSRLRGISWPPLKFGNWVINEGPSLRSTDKTTSGKKTNAKTK